MKFSIFVPIYKRKFLSECIESVLSQTYPLWELILINDNSPEDLDSVVSRYSDPRIRYYKRAKGYGAKLLVDNWNDGLNYVSGEYVINMGDDDKLLPNCLEDYIETINAYPNFDIYKTRLEFIDEKSNIIGLQPAVVGRESVYSLMWHDWEGRPSAIGDYLFRVSALKMNGGFYNLPYAWHSDRITSFILAEDKGVVHTGKYGFQFRKSTLNITYSKNQSKERIKGWNLCKEWYRNFLLKEPGNMDDKLYWDLLRSNCFVNIERIKRIEISRSYQNSIANIFYWLNHKEIYLITSRQIFQALGIYFINLIKTLIR